jgi:hypothetical protein
VANSTIVRARASLLKLGDWPIAVALLANDRAHHDHEARASAVTTTVERFSPIWVFLLACRADQDLFGPDHAALPQRGTFDGIGLHPVAAVARHKAILPRGPEMWLSADRSARGMWLSADRTV